MTTSNRVLPSLLLAALLVIAAAALLFSWLATRVDIPPPTPAIINTSTATNNGEESASLPPVQPPSPLVRWAWRAPEFHTDATPECGFDSMFALAAGKDTLYVRSQVMPVWMGERLVYQVGRWQSSGAMLLAVDNDTLPITRCGGGTDWDRVGSVVAVNGLLVAHVETGLPAAAAALYVWPMRTTLALVDPSERPSDLRFTNGEFGIYSWSAAQSTVYLRRSADGGRTWTAPRLLMTDAVRPRFVDTGRAQLLGAYQPSTGNIRFLLHTNDWAPTPQRTLPLAPGADRLEVGGYRNLSQWTRIVSWGALVHVVGSDARSNRSVLVSARTCNTSDVFPGCVSSTIVARCTPNQNVLETSCLRLAIPQLHDYHAISRNDALAFDFRGKSDGDQTAVVDALALPNGTLATLYYRVRATLAQMELTVRVGDTNFLVDTFDGTSQAASGGGLAFDAPALRISANALWIAYSRPLSGIAQPEGYDIDTRERSHMTVAVITL